MTEAQEDQELVMALLQCEDDWQRAEILALYGHYDKADKLSDECASHMAQALLDRIQSYLAANWHAQRTVHEQEQSGHEGT